MKKIIYSCKLLYPPISITKLTNLVRNASEEVCETEPFRLFVTQLRLN